jgi:membrane protease YdiL (CAAX protease family)
MDTNQTSHIQKQWKAGHLLPKKIYAALFLRLGLFALVQAGFAGIYFLLNQPNPWMNSAKWWIVVAAITNVITILLLVRWFKQENTTYFSVIHFEKATIKQDLLTLLGVFILLGPIGFLPNPIFAGWIFGDAQIGFDLLMQPLPLWVVIIFMVLFPVTIAFAELPLYFGYIKPRLEVITGKAWLAVLLPALFLAAQHCTLPLIFDWRFILWRFLMFLPFAIFLGFVIHWRPRLLPYLMVIHGIMDFGTSIYLLTLTL